MGKPTKKTSKYFIFEKKKEKRKRLVYYYVINMLIILLEISVKETYMIHHRQLNLGILRYLTIK